MSPRTRLFAAAALGLAAAFTALLGEVALRLFVSPEVVLHGSAQHEWGWRSRHAGADPARSQAGYDFDRFDPELGWVPAPDYRSDAIRTNSLGIRADREYAFERTPGVRRIVLLGDSYTWGERTWHGEIRNEETFAALLEEELPATETINLGVHGWGTDQQLLYLRRLGLRFQPDLVILGFFEADLPRNVLDFFGYAKPRFRLEGGRLVLVDRPIPEAEALLDTELEMPASWLLSLLRKGLDTVLDRTRLRPIEGRESWRVTRAIFDAARRETEAAGARFLLVDIPFSVRRRPTPVEAAVAHWAEQTGADFLSLRERFAELPEAEWGTLHDGHFTVRGHRVTAQALAELVVREGLIPAVESDAAPARP
jgi:hypothetical protein